jgi:hypothetical protein
LLKRTRQCTEDALATIRGVTISLIDCAHENYEILSDDPISYDKSVPISSGQKEITRLIHIKARHQSFRIVAGGQCSRETVPALASIAELMNPPMRPFAGAMDAGGGIGHRFDQAE